MISGVRLKPQHEKNIFYKISRNFYKLKNPYQPSWIKRPDLVAKCLDDCLSRHLVKSKKELLILLRNGLAFMRPARERERSFWGRFLNRISAAETEYIDLDGTVLSGILELLGDTANMDINSSNQYSVPFCEVEKMVARLTDLP